MATDVPPTYTTQNFDAVNDYIGHLADRHRARTARWRSDTVGTYLKWSAVLITATGAAAFLVLWGLSFWREEPDFKVMEPVVVDRHVIINLDERFRARGGRPDGADRPNRQPPRVPNDAPKSDTPKEPTPARPEIDFVVFKYFDFSRDGLKTVVVGMQYKGASMVAPSSQWCYVNKVNLSGTMTRVDLAENKGDGLKFHDITSSQAQEVGTTVGTLKAAQRLCQFE